MPHFTTPHANGTPTDFKEGSVGGKIRLMGTYVGFIKDNKDNQRNGRLRVYIPELGGDPTSDSSWHWVQYASPFAGATPLSGNKDNDKTMQGTQISYGFWMIPPDLDNQVLCCFANGDLSQGYWFACVYQENMNHMVPAVALNVSTKDDINKINLPVVCEYNKKDTDATKNPSDPKRPIFEPLHNGLTAQGLYEDPERGPATTSARREAPSQVFGVITPRANSIHIDDDPNNEFIRLRTRSGAQILIHETTGYIYMISKNGNSWVEISDIGIDMYSKRSISLRAEENINLHADQNMISHGAGAHHGSGANMTKSSSGHIHHKAAGDHKTDAKTIKHNSKDAASKKSTDPATDKASADKDAAAAKDKPAYNADGKPTANDTNALSAADMKNQVGKSYGNGECVTDVKNIPGMTDAYGNPLAGTHAGGGNYVAQTEITPDNVASTKGMAIMTATSVNSDGVPTYNVNGGEHHNGDHMAVSDGTWNYTTDSPNGLGGYVGHSMTIGGLPYGSSQSYYTVGLKGQY